MVRPRRRGNRDKGLVLSTVRFRNVSKVFDHNTHAASDFNLEINDGELMVLVGPSGCGKSTLLRMLAGLEEVSQGKLYIDEQLVNNLTPQQRNIAMVFQNYALYPHMSVRRNLAFPLTMMKLSKPDIETRVNEISDLLGLTNLLDRKPKQLSGGQRQRVAMGRAFVRQPKVFLMDEPLSNLDAKLRLQIRSEIAALQKRMNTTMLYVTHDQVEAMTIGDRVAVIHQGQLQQVAEPQALYEQPANIFVAGFIGNPGMNVFRTKLVEVNEQQLAIRWGDKNLVLSKNICQKQSVRRYVGQTIYAGLRPEAIHQEDAYEMGTMIKAKITSIEALGHEYLVYFTSEQTTEKSNQIQESSGDIVPETLVARLSQKLNPGVGDIVDFNLDLTQIYLFNSDGVAL